jgi:hypothetical protein
MNWLEGIPLSGPRETIRRGRHLWFDWVILSEPRILVIIDLDDGAPSVTNSADEIVRDACRTMVFDQSYPIIYRDTMAAWDLLYHHNGEFRGFGRGGARLKDAIQSAKVWREP